MEKRRVLLVCVRSLLGESVGNVLRHVEDVELMGPWALDSQVLPRLAQEIPDVVLVAEDGGERESLTYLTVQILEHYPDLPILRIGLAGNVVRLYTSRTLPARSADLIEVIRCLPARQPEG